ncbi:protein of unknown function DUF1573 [Isosphaera pallida ATCC 43644]|jgi:hypothetical protein|uniref:DUF1573 domain-containing protein n=1 Tax=Isosphaera pallida (strain ATCC 43644 / DSM 9630 / IS1B) TaxID=575540 RepID=E8QWP4_ISOPI|nr:DUF1573 domain-containing protein [Isosphaera pallida]ADV62944.1 protein of unknown function DUF1573 [Isosphaera pallida ATCC 43644]
MMRWVLLVVGVVGATAAIKFVPLLLMEAPSQRDVTVPVVGVDPNQGPRPRLVVLGIDKFQSSYVYDFGAMAQNAKGSHEWTIKNEGEADLILGLKDKSCSCIVPKMKEGESTAVIKPGEATTITLEWDTKANNGPYEQYASFSTNDPEAVQIEFRARGMVRPPVLINPPATSINFGTINRAQGASTDITLVSPDLGQLEILGSRPSLAGLTATAVPLPAEQRKKLDLAENEGALLVTLSLPAGMPLGPFREEIQLQLNHPQMPTLDFTLSGQVEGSIVPYPPTIRRTDIVSDKGGASDVTLNVRDKRPTTLTIQSVPEGLQAVLKPLDERGQPLEGAAGDTPAIRHRLTVTVPPGTSGPTIQGNVVITSDHPEAPEVLVPVKLIILPPSRR